MAFARALVGGFALLLAAESLVVDPGPRLAQDGNELAADADREGSEWPWGRRLERRNESKAKEDLPPQSRMAVLVSGSVEGLVLSPLLSSLVRANARAGLRVDVFFGLTAPTKGKHEGAVDPKMSQFLQNFDAAKLRDFVCQLARQQGASYCSVEFDTHKAVHAPRSEARQRIMTHYQNSTEKRMGEVARWRSLSLLLSTARTHEVEAEYDAVAIARADSYWLAPVTVNIEEFQMDSLQVLVPPCLDDTGINDKAMIMGREAADVMLSAYDMWQRAEERLSGTRTAEEVLFRIASQAGLRITPQPMYLESASFTQTGLPCFDLNSHSFALSQQRYQQCFAESVGDAPVAEFFATFGCEVRNPNFYDLLWPQQVQKLQDNVARLAFQDERKALVLTVVSEGEVEQAVSMLTGLQGLEEEALVLTVGTSANVCRALRESPGVSGSKCIVMMPTQEVRLSLFKHAILTTVALAGLTDRIMYASPQAAFGKALSPQLAASDNRILFARNTLLDTTGDAVGCIQDISVEEGPFDLAHVDTSVLILPDAPEVASLLLRAWDRMAEGISAKGAVSQQAALVEVLRTSGRPDVGLLPCGVQLPRSSTERLSGEDKILSAEQPPGISDQEVKRQLRQALDAAWVDKFKGEATKERRARSDDGAAARADAAAGQQRRAEWKDLWVQRIQELREKNGYNETAVREERHRQRAYNKAHKTHKKHVRYLPPDEAMKVKAREEKWEANIQKQKDEDQANRQTREEAFKREVSKAQDVIYGNYKEAQEGADGSTGQDDAGASIFGTIAAQ